MPSFSDAINLVVNGRCVLFLGAGASVGATNKTGTALPTGPALATLLAAKCGLSPDLDLARASEFFLEDFGSTELIALLKEQLTATRLSPHHLSLAQTPWMRIYTTNYDNVYELGRAQLSFPISAITPLERPEDVPGGVQCCVHINGDISHLNSNTLHNAFKLSTTSYLTQHFHESTWIDTFRTDLRLADAIFFVGYSLYDLDIQRILFVTPDLKSKTFFVTTPKASKADERLLSRFGSVEKIGASYFGTLLDGALATQTADPDNQPLLRSWTKSTSIATRHTGPTEDEVIQMLLWGNVDPALIAYCDRTPDAHAYLFPREVVPFIRKQLLDNHHDVIVHSHLGNGKTIIQEQLRNQLHDQGAEVYELTVEDDKAIAEARDIMARSTNLVIFVIPSYAGNIRLVNDIAAHRTESVRLVLFARTSTNDVVFRNLRESFRDTCREVDVNKLRAEDISSLIAYFNLYGLWGEYSGRDDDAGRGSKRWLIESKCRFETSSLLMLLLKSPQMKARIQEVVAAFQSDKALLDVLIAIMIFNSLDQTYSGNMLLDLVDVDFQAKLRRNESYNIREVISSDAGGVLARSPIAAKFMLQDVFESRRVVDVLIRISREAGKRYSYRNLLKELVRYSNVQSIITKEGRLKNAVRFYEAIKGIQWLNRDPHFWLQYGIARLALEDVVPAERYFNVAYAKARATPGYDTTMIDNHFARLLLVKACSPLGEASFFELFKEAATIVKGQAGRFAERHHPYRVAAQVERVFERYEGALSLEQKAEMLAFCVFILERIELLPEGLRSHRSVRDCKSRLTRIVTRHDANRN